MTPRRKTYSRLKKREMVLEGYPEVVMVELELEIKWQLNS